MSGSSAKGKRIYGTVVILAVLLLAVFTFGKNVLFVKIAKGKIDNGKYSEAQWYLSKSNGSSAEDLLRYVGLRTEINAKYPIWLSEYDEDAFNTLRKTAAGLVENKKHFSGKSYSELCEISQALDTICTAQTEYKNMRDDILDMMDVFSEINRLYTTDETGKNISFTVEEELSKIDKWKKTNTSLETYTARLPYGNKVYLLIYLIKETHGECDDIEEAMELVLNSGYSETDSVRFNGSAKKTFPGVTNGNGSKVNISEKEEYEHYMYVSICQSLVQSIAEFYS